MEHKNIKIWLIIVGLLILLLVVHGMIDRPINSFLKYFVYIEHFGTTFFIPLFAFLLGILLNKQNTIKFWFILGIIFGSMLSLIVYDICQYLSFNDFNQIYQIILDFLGVVISLIIITILDKKLKK